MTNLEKMYDLAHKNNIVIHFFNLKEIGLLGLNVEKEELPHMIFLDLKLKGNNDLHLEVLGHELGHYFTTVGNALNIKSYRDILYNNKFENKATDWSTNYIITNKELTKALEYGCNSFYEIAEFLNVNEFIVRDKFEYLARKSSTGYVQLGSYKVILTNLPNIYLYKDL